MIKIFEFLLHGCWHKWKIVSSNDLRKKGYQNPIGTRVTYQCEKCNHVKHTDMT